MGRSKSAASSEAAYKAVKGNDGESLQILLAFWIEKGVSPLSNRDDTILHFIARHGNVDALKKLLVEEITRPVSSEDLKIKNKNGDTPLHEAARFGKKDIVEMILSLDRDLVLMRNNLGETPLYVAASSGEEEVFTFLADQNFDDMDNAFTTMTTREDGSTVLHAAITDEFYSFALQLLKMYPELARKQDKKGNPALSILATKHSSFRSGSLYAVEQIGTAPFVPIQVLEIFMYFCIPIMYKESKPSNNLEDPMTADDVLLLEKKRSPLINFLLGNAWLGVIDIEKQKHMLALILARRLIEEAADWSFFAKPLIQATELGINELVVEIIQKCPQAVETVDGDGKNILHIAAGKKNRFLFDYFMKNIANKDRMLADTDQGKNTILHSAASVGSPFKFSNGDLPDEARGFKTLLIMAWGVLWFKRVKYCVNPRLWTVKNNAGVTAKQLFEQNHSVVRKEAEKTIRALANYVLILATLLCTISFAAVFTIPGEFDDKSGRPRLLLKKDTKTDLWMLQFFLGAALYDSVFTMGNLLSILLSKFDSDDFYIALPTKFFSVVISVYYSTACTVLASVQALNVENIFLNKDVWWLIVCFLILGFYMTLIALDIAYFPFDYMYYFASYSFSYKRLDM